MMRQEPPGRPSYPKLSQPLEEAFPLYQWLNTEETRTPCLGTCSRDGLKLYPGRSTAPSPIENPRLPSKGPFTMPRNGCLVKLGSSSVAVVCHACHSLSWLSKADTEAARLKGNGYICTALSAGWWAFCLQSIYGRPGVNNMAAQKWCNSILAEVRKHTAASTLQRALRAGAFGLMIRQSSTSE